MRSVSGDNNAFAEHEPCVEPVAHGDGTDGGGQGEGQVVGYGGYPEVGDHGQAESLCNADDYRNRNRGAGRVVDDVRQDNVKGDYRYDKGEFAVEIDSGDDLCEGIRRSAAVDERAAMRWSTPVASHAMLMISEPARRKTSSAE